ncbi:MAG: RdgB/HAM1 family non-canonical purine NTP pyrophosphatase [Rhodospirillales bacterium]|nr:RdgB/HAM1 family non-canonical purine NTP pyrophosphatase [Rhodospirillales bacterium]
MSPWAGGRLVIASHNPGKVTEIADLLRPFAVEVVGAAALGLPEPEETGASFAANARLKAEAAAKASGLPSLSDDSGLVVPALGGTPGIHSARYAKEAGGFGPAMERLHRELAALPESMSNPNSIKVQSAYFVCALAMAWPEGRTLDFEGRVDGVLVWPPRGENGFGYDPIFQAQGQSQTFGEMEPQAKHAISHRARAFAKLVESVFAKP